MSKHPPWLIPAGVTLVTLVAVFGGLVAVLTWRLRAELRDQVLRREAEAIHSVVLLQQASATARLADYGAGDSTDDLFAAILESSRLRGVLVVRLFDGTGRLLHALPAVPQPDRIERELQEQVLPRGPLARFHAQGNLGMVFGDATLADHSAPRVPLLEVAVPVQLTPTATVPGVAHYWIDGAALAAEFARMDRGLFRQGALAFGAGVAAIVLVLGWAFLRLDRVQRALRLRSEDLVRANQELAFAAKTAAIGAISAHLIHGLKNPLAGLEGFVADTAAGNGGAADDAAVREATATAQRVRQLVNDVVAVLREESGLPADYRVTAAEVVASARVRTAADASRAGVTIAVVAAPGLEVTARIGNLASLVLANLLANAVAVSLPGGRVDVNAAAAPAGLTFTVSDQGPGLSDAVRAALFRPVRSAHGGGGIGLAISQQLARHAGGQLELVRSDSQGTVFRLVVPAI